jgi:hypothetical protein
MEMIAHNQRRGDSVPWKILGYLLDLALGLLIVWMVATWKKIDGIEESVTRINGRIEAHSDMMQKMQIVMDRLVTEAGALREWKAETAGNRFTAGDGAAVWREIAAIRESIAKMPTEVPPRWFVERVDKIDARLGKIEEKVAANATALGVKP